MLIIAWAYEADYHCPDCAWERFGYDLEDPDTVDDEGNPLHPIFSWDEPPIGGIVCGDCGEVIVPPVDAWDDDLMYFDEEESTMTIKFDWVYEQSPDWDSSGTITASWTAEVGKYVARIDHFRTEDGGGYAYSVSIDGTFVKDGENESADTFEDAECAIRRLLAERL